MVRGVVVAPENSIGLIKQGVIALEDRPVLTYNLLPIRTQEGRIRHGWSL